MSEDRWSVDVEPYVLGALDEEERQAFEAHLPGCPDCRAGVDSVAALPELLDQVPADLVRGLSADVGLGPEGLRRSDEPPAVLLRDLLRVAQREEVRRRKRRYVVGALAVAAVTALVLAVPGLGVPVPWGTTSEPGVTAQAIRLEPVVDTPVTASVRLDDVAWGTRIDLTCRYEESDGGGGAPYRGGGGNRYGSRQQGYALVVRGADGVTEEVATWSAVPGREVSVPGSTLLPRADIVEVELRSDDGTVLLSAPTT